MKIIAKTIFGSHLYGTNVAGSDLDYKVIYQATLEDILLNRNVSITREGQQTEVECEYIELREYIKHLISGQTYAVDMLFTPREQVLETSEIWNDIRENRNKWLSKDCKSFIGYCSTQAKIYSKKGIKIETYKKGLDLLTDARGNVADYKDELIEIKVPLVRKSFKRNGFDVEQDFFELFGKFFALTVNVKEIKTHCEDKLKELGVRAHNSYLNNNKDWKAIYHAFRVIWELKELAQTGQIKFPCERAKDLLEIRKGTWFDYKPELLEWEMESATSDMRFTSKIQDKVDMKFVESKLLEYYGIKI